MATRDAEAGSHPGERKPETLAEALVALTSHLATREQVDERSDATNEHLDGIEDGMHQRFDGFEDGLHQRLDDFEDGMHQRFDGLNRRIVAVAGGVALLVAVAAGLSLMVSNFLLSL